MIDKPLYISLKSNESGAEGSGLTWSKEVIYTGTFYAPQADGSSVKFSVALEDLQKWKESIDLQLERGVRVDVPVSHTTNPEASRGKVISAEVRKDSKDRDSLWVTIEFADEQGAKLAKTTDVSLYSPPSWKDGLGNVYSRPIRHVALTQQPVIADLDAFTLVASLDEGSTSMDFLMQIAQAIGLEPVDGEDEAALTDRILSAITSEETDEDMGDGMDDMDDMEDMGEDPGLDVEGGGGMDDAAMSLSFQREVIEGRKSRLELLLSQGRINPAQKARVEAKYCVRGGLKLSNEFDSTIATLSLSEPRRTGSRTGAQLPHGTQLDPLGADVARRSKTGVN